ncbi:putative 2OG-Fe(II) oxygenase [Solimonas terrae]|uniref:Fe2OG dioxygenase domain-containing protein n=1 Tax=Solimonas terrae TaxID=1396819 RepID=A0A6M2BWU9_9GAMM|nr:putative 2OG-Fe(II) oxygenase [Solimonas terrae]NGY06978.1 hypothetical protein [Solimonas terrae]
MARINPMFAVPSLLIDHPDHGELNRALRQLFLAREGQEHYGNPGATMKINPGLFESTFRLFDWSEPCIARLRDFCWSTLYGLIGELNGYDTEVLRRLHINADAWFHVTRKGGYFGIHNHPMASWSGVYCVDDGGDSEAHPESGMLNFQHPNPMSAMYLDMAAANLRPPYSTAGRMFRLRPGQLIIFPSWLLHQVMPFHGPGERITVAFNAWFRLEGAMPSKK